MFKYYTKLGSRLVSAFLMFCAPDLSLIVQLVGIVRRSCSLCLQLYSIAGIPNFVLKIGIIIWHVSALELLVSFIGLNWRYLELFMQRVMCWILHLHGNVSCAGWVCPPFPGTTILVSFNFISSTRLVP